MYTPETSNGDESAKIATVVIPYLQGRFLDLGAGTRPVWPSAISVDNHRTFGVGTVGIKADIADLSLFADGSMDAVFSSHALEDFAPSQVPSVLKEWSRVIKVGGHLVLYVPSANLYPKMGEAGANTAHKWDIFPGDIERILREQVSEDWCLVESEERGGTNEYSILVAARKLQRGSGWSENVWQRNPGGKERCLVIRLGAIGDAIQTSSIFPKIKEQGFHLTVNCKPETYEILKLDPFVDEWVLQATDFVPNQELQYQWEGMKDRYDRVINLCESIEGGLLTMPGRLNHQYPDDVRRTLYGGVSYLGRTHDIAGVAHDYNPRFFPSDQEVKKAAALRRAWVGNGRDGLVPLVLWALAGSATHKIYPHTATVLRWLLERTPCHVVLTGDKGVGKDLQAALVAGEHYEGCDLSRLHPMAGRWTIRETLAVAQACDVVVGPETGVLNAVSFVPSIGKVLYLSHSSKGNIGGDWLNTEVLSPDAALSPCFPCHRLHADWQYCFRSEETHAALCATSIRPEVVFRAIMKQLGATASAG